MVLVLSSLLATVNASQAMVLCIGCDGHIAIEPAGHDHRADGSHLCESDAAVHDTRLAADAGDARCGGCTDIPMAQATGGDPSVSKLIPTLLAFSCPMQTLPAAILTPAGFESRVSHSSQSISLSSIVLQV